jgi:protein-tyrosine phosphatase
VELGEIQGLVDIHTHILHGVDDGAKDLQDALALLRLARENGTTQLVLTPHYRGHWRSNTPRLLRERFAELSEQAAKELPDVKLYLGNEAGIEREVGEKVAEGRILPVGDSRYVLLEFDYNSSRIQVINGVMEVISSGFMPIIAHAERYDIFRKDKQLPDEILHVGAMIQLNADSVMGSCGLRAKLCCLRLLSRGQVHFIASDGHDLKYRKPVLRDCFAYVAKRFGEEYAWVLFRDQAKAILSGQRR